MRPLSIQRRLVGACLLSLGAFAPASLTWAEGGVAQPAAAPSVKSTLSELEKVVRALDANARAQEEAWPRREEQLAQEVAPPRRVRELETVQARLERQKRHVEKTLHARASDDPKAVLDALATTENPTFATCVAPVAVTAAKKHADTLDVLADLAVRLDPCPMKVVDSVAALGTEEASRFLLDWAIQDKRMSLFVAAGKAGDPVVIDQLITLAAGKGELAEPTTAALRRLAPPEAASDALRKTVTTHIRSVRSPAVRSVLISYLGLCRHPGDYKVFKSFIRDRQEVVRLAAIAALGNLGTSAAPLLLGELRERGNSIATRQACLHALGATRYQGAVPTFIDALGEPRLRNAALTALRRTAGQDLGKHKGAWLRWWRAQPESGEAARDPDDG